MSKRFVLPRENVNVPVSHLAKVAVDQLESAVSSSSAAQGEDIESAPGFDGLDEFDVSRNLELTARANALLAPDGHATVSELKEVLPGLAELRESMAGRLGVTIPQDTGSQWFTVDEEPAEDQIPPPPSGSEEAIEKELSEEVGSVVYPRVEANDFYRVPELIAKAIENSLKEHGSWDGPLEAVVKKYRDQADGRVPSVEARDKVAIVHGIRKAMEVLKPGLSRTLSDDEIKNSIIFEASLLMFNGLERSLVKQTGARNGTDEGMRMNGRGYTGETIASSFQVSAWITSTRPVAPAALAASVRDRVHDLFAASESGASKAELKLHLDMAEKLVDMTCDVTKLMQFRYDKAMRTLNDVIGTLKAGTKRPTFDDRGFMNDIEPIDVEDPNAEFDYDNIHTHNPRSAMHLRTFLQSYQDPAVQESLKAVLSAAYQIAAMSKFYQELDVVPASLEDLVSRNQMLKRHSIPENVSIAEWLSTQAIGDSNLLDENQGLVDHLDQPYFIANNVDAWLSSLTRKSFGAIGNIGEMLMAESHEYAALKTKIADLENFYSMMFGTNVEDGGEILKILEHTGEYKMEDGVVVRKEGDTYVKFDNYNKVTCKVTMTEADLQVVDLFLKMCSAYASGQESVITGVDNIYFDSTMSDDPAFYDREKLLARYNNGRPAKQLNSVEMALVRLTKQMPESVLSSDNNGLGYYDRVVAAFVKAIRDAKKACSRRTVVRDESGAVVGTELDESPAGSALFNAVAIDSLVRSGVARGLNRDGKTIRVQGKYGESIHAAKTVTGGKASYSVPKYTKAVISVSCDDIDALFRLSDAYAKLTSVDGGRTAEMLSRDTVVKDFMKVYRDAMSFVRRHPWLTHGDGQYFNGFGTALPFWRGSGVFMYNAVRSLRDHPAEIAEAMSVEEATVKNVLMSEDAEKPGPSSRRDGPSRCQVRLDSEGQAPGGCDRQWRVRGRRQKVRHHDPQAVPRRNRRRHGEGDIPQLPGRGVEDPDRIRRFDRGSCQGRANPRHVRGHHGNQGGDVRRFHRNQRRGHVPHDRYSPCQLPDRPQDTRRHRRHNQRHDVSCDLGESPHDPVPRRCPRVLRGPVRHGGRYQRSLRRVLGPDRQVVVRIQRSGSREARVRSCAFRHSERQEDIQGAARRPVRVQGLHPVRQSGRQDHEAGQVPRTRQRRRRHRVG